MLQSEHLRTEVRDEVAVVTLDRPRSLNALTPAMRRDVSAALRHFGDGTSARGIVITGQGRAFSSGADLHAASEVVNGFTAAADSFHDMTRAALTTKVPVVGAINGIAVGGAAELTLSFDSRIGSGAAEYFFPENGIGLVISNASSYLLPRLIGRRALPTVLASRRIAAQECVTLGLLDQAVEGDPVRAAIELITAWTSPGSATREHLLLLRPPLDEVEKAFARETAGVTSAERAGLSGLGLRRFRERPRG